jgi:ATP-dependent DNA helicase RecG
MRSDDKRAAMEAFATGAAQVLVATTVVEVGVDVPNATLMVVLGAEAFGLTQLHQLRGRVGRGGARSVCVLVHGPGMSATSSERLQILADVDDGFAVAEADLRLRGPGEAWGTRQSGLPRFKLADPARDQALLAHAHEDARTLVTEDPQLRRPEHEVLRRTLLDRFPEPLGLALAG